MAINSSRLPGATSDLEQAKADLDECGYCLLAEALDAATVGALRARLQEQAEAEKQLGVAFEDGGPEQQWGAFRDACGRIRPQAFREDNGGVNQRVWMLLNKGRVFVDLLEHPQIDELAAYLLGPEYILSSYTANIAKPGGVAMDLHTDQWWMPEPTRRGRRALAVGAMTRTRLDVDDSAERSLIAPPACCNVIYMLCDFSERNGATRVVPGSHQSGRHPDPERDKGVTTVAAAGPAGTALVTDGRLWHGTGANTARDGEQRYALLTTFCGPQFRAQENWTVGASDAVLRDATPKLRRLLGLKVWHAYGRTGHPTVEYIDRSEPPVGELRPA